MTNEQDEAAIEVRIRMPVYRSGVWYVVFAGSLFGFLLGEDFLIKGPRWGALPSLAFGCCFVALGLVRRSTGVDLTPEFAIVRRPQRQTVPWSTLQAVTSHLAANGCSAVRLGLQAGATRGLPSPPAGGRPGA